MIYLDSEKTCLVDIHNNQENPVFYLSGGMEFKTDLGVGWRQWLTSQLEDLNYCTIDPTKIEAPIIKNEPLQRSVTDLKVKGKLDQVRTLVRDRFFRKDIYAIQMSAAMIVYYDLSVQKGAGTLAEAWESFREGKPVYLVSDLPVEDIPSWLIGETTEIFFSFQELIEYLKDRNKVFSDIKLAEEVAKNILGDLYTTKKIV